MRFDSFLIVDWSGGGDRGPRPKKDAIWSALLRPGAAPQTEYHRSRAVAEPRLAEILDAERAAGRRVLAGFDFPFAYPAGFAARITGTPDPLALWDWFAARLPADAPPGERFHLAGGINAGFPGTGPFWFNGLSRDVDHLPRKGRERQGHGQRPCRHVETLTPGTFTCWQMGGAGAVGSQVMTGMAALARLRARFAHDLAVWPFQPRDAGLLLVEIWPSLIAGPVRAVMAADPAAIKDQVQVSLLAVTLAALDAQGRLEPALDAATGPDLAEEGWILGAGAEDDFRATAAAVLAQLER